LLLDQALGDFGLVADEDLCVMQPGQELPELTARALTGLSHVFQRQSPDLVIAQGDTTTVLCSALACYYHRVPFCHVKVSWALHGHDGQGTPH
jgi:UDP-N-acetylglucosamine 2-epimerase (non-hydrolysing)